jgi:guanidinopropionase
MNKKDFRQYDVNTVPRFANLNPFMRANYQENPDGLDIAMVGVPFDLGSSFRIGSRHGPAQMREMSRMIRQVHYPSMLEPFERFRIADVGDAPVNSLDIEESLEGIEAFFQKIHTAGALTLAAGGDHTITLPILRAIARDHPLSLVQFDAHSDTIDTMLGKKFANGTPIRRAIEEGLLDPKSIVQIGLRGTLFKADDLDWAKEQGIEIIDMDDFFEMGLSRVIDKIHEVVGDNLTYLTFDIDSLDPAFAPGAGGLEPGGLTVREAQLLLRGLKGIRFTGADINEVCPPLDPSGNTALVACHLMFEQLCLLVESSAKKDE